MGVVTVEVDEAFAVAVAIGSEGAGGVDEAGHVAATAAAVVGCVRITIVGTQGWRGVFSVGGAGNGTVGIVAR